jgi:hypothetical protein
MSRKRVVSRCYGVFEWQRFVCGLVEFEEIVAVIGSSLILIAGVCGLCSEVGDGSSISEEGSNWVMVGV